MLLLLLCLPDSFPKVFKMSSGLKSEEPAVPFFLLDTVSFFLTTFELVDEPE